MQQKLTIPQGLLDHCKALGIPTSGNVVGKNSTTDFSGQPFVNLRLIVYAPFGTQWSLSRSDRWGPFTQSHLIGWTPKAKGALAGCVLTALLGIITVAWYSMHAFTEEEAHAAQQRKFEDKLVRGGKFARAKVVFSRKN